MGQALQAEGTAWTQALRWEIVTLMRMIMLIITVHRALAPCLVPVFMIPWGNLLNLYCENPTFLSGSYF